MKAPIREKLSFEPVIVSISSIGNLNLSSSFELLIIFSQKPALHFLSLLCSKFDERLSGPDDEYFEGNKTDGSCVSSISASSPLARES